MMMIPPLIQLPTTAATIAATIIGLSSIPTPTATTMMTPSSPSSLLTADNSNSIVPVLEVIKVYGKLAGSQCYGKLAPKGSSCEMTLIDVEELFFGNNQGSSLPSSSSQTVKSSISEQEFGDRLQTNAKFEWPLKPYGIEKSNSKTATMNKGAETKVYMDLLEERGLYDRRNPTGPLPTSLRPQLNAQLQKEGIQSNFVKHKTFLILGGSESSGELQQDKLKEVLSQREGNSIDYYDFLELIGKESITWPY